MERLLTSLDKVMSPGIIRVPGWNGQSAPQATLRAVVAIWFALSPAIAVAQPELIGHWKFDDVVNRVTPDASGRGHDGRVHGARLGEGVEGQALYFDGKDDYVVLGDLGEHESVTIAFWMRREAARGNENEEREGGDRWQGLVSSDGWESGVLHIPFDEDCVDVYYHEGDSSRGRLRSGPLRAGRWYHVAVVTDTKSRWLKLYVNGQECAYDQIQQFTGMVKLPRQVVGRESESRYYHGAIDDVRIYDAALQGAHIAALCPDVAPAGEPDMRNIRYGRPIPDEGYCDQPYVVVNKRGEWVCLLTTGGGEKENRGSISSRP